MDEETPRSLIQGVMATAATHHLSARPTRRRSRIARTPQSHMYNASLTDYLYRQTRSATKRRRSKGDGELTTPRSVIESFMDVSKTVLPSVSKTKRQRPFPAVPVLNKSDTNFTPRTNILGLIDQAPEETPFIGKNRKLSQRHSLPPLPANMTINLPKEESVSYEEEYTRPEPKPVKTPRQRKITMQPTVSAQNLSRANRRRSSLPPLPENTDISLPDDSVDYEEYTGPAFKPGRTPKKQRTRARDKISVDTFRAGIGPMPKDITIETVDSDPQSATGGSDVSPAPSLTSPVTEMEEEEYADDERDDDDVDDDQATQTRNSDESILENQNVNANWNDGRMGQQNRTKKDQLIKSVKDNVIELTPQPDINQSEIRDVDLNQSEHRDAHIHQSESRDEELNRSANRSVVLNQSASRVVDLNQSESRGLVLNQSASRAVDLNQSANRGVVLNQSASRGINLNQSANRGVDLNQSANRGVDLNQSANRSVVLNQSASRGINLNQSANRGVDLNQSANRSVVLNQSASRGINVNQSANRGVDSNQSASRGVVLNQSASRSIDLNQSANRGVDLNQSANRSVVLNQSASRGVDLNQSASKGEDLNQSASRGVDLNQSASRGVDLNESASRGVDLNHSENRGVHLSQSESRDYFNPENDVQREENVDEEDDISQQDIASAVVDDYDKENENEDEVTGDYTEDYKLAKTPHLQTPKPAHLQQLKIKPVTSVSSKSQVTENVSEPPPKAKPKQQRRKRDLPNSSLPPNIIKKVFAGFCKMRVSKDTLPELINITEQFFAQVAQDLEAFCEHAGRKTIQSADVELLMRRQGFVTEKRSLNSLVEKHLPLELRQKIIPVARSGNKVVP